MQRTPACHLPKATLTWTSIALSLAARVLLSRIEGEHITTYLYACFCIVLPVAIHKYKM